MMAHIDKCGRPAGNTTRTPGLAVRVVACALCTRWPQAPFVIGVPSLLGFLTAYLAGSCGLLTPLTYLTCALLSLTTFNAALLVGALGCPHELLRRRERQLVTPPQHSQHSPLAN